MIQKVYFCVINTKSKCPQRRRKRERPLVIQIAAAKAARRKGEGMMKSETIFSGRRAAPWLLGALLTLRFPLLILGGTSAAAAAVYLVDT